MQPYAKIGKLLPTLDLTGNVQGINFNNGLLDGQSNRYIEHNNYNAYDGMISLKQPLYNYGAYKDFMSATESADFAKQDYRTSYQQFLYDVSFAYFNLAKNIKNVEYTSFNKKAAEANLNELEKQFAVGAADIVDYETSKSNYNISVADYTAAVRDERVARAQLHKFTNNDDDIVLYSNDFEIKTPNPNTEEEWEQLVVSSNPSYLGSIHNKESKYYDYQSATSSFMPVIDFELKYSPGFNERSNIGNPILDNFLDARGPVDTFYIGINASWSIFSGGTDYAKLKQAAYEYQASEFTMIQTSRVAQNDAMYSFRFVEYKKEQITSLRKSVASAKIAYEKFRDKFDNGTTTITQYFIILNQYYQYLIDLNNVETEYVLGFLSLYKTAGILTTDTVRSFNDWILFDQQVEL